MMFYVCFIILYETEKYLKYNIVSRILYLSLVCFRYAQVSKLTDVWIDVWQFPLLS